MAETTAISWTDHTFNPWIGCQHYAPGAHGVYRPLRGDGPKLDWVIVGGESGRNRRPCQVQWIADVVEQCRSAGVPCFVKQDSALKPGQQGRIPDDLWAIKEFPRPALAGRRPAEAERL